MKMNCKVFKLDKNVFNNHYNTFQTIKLRQCRGSWGG